MLNQEAVLLLRRTAELGVLAPKQTDDLVRATWSNQQGVCPVCAEEVQWHRGSVYQNCYQVAWVCMVCSLLEIQEFRRTLTKRDGSSVERQVPLPPDHVLAWLNTDWIHRDEDEPVPAATDVARRLGSEATDRIWAAIIEDSKAARLSQPNSDPTESWKWKPFILREGSSRSTRGARLLNYMGSPEERSTTEFIHQSLGIEPDGYTTHTVISAAGREIEICVIPDAIMGNISNLSAESRRDMIPRLGLTDRTLWKSHKHTDPFSIQSLARTAEFSGGMLFYLIPFDSCGDFYSTRNDHQWMSHMFDYCDEVGFDFAKDTDGDAATSQSLWQRIFGDILIPD